MALIKLGGIVTQISGKMGGTSFGTSASGSYAKNSGRPRKSITLLQQSKMSLMGTTAQAWRALTVEQRDAYNAASPEYPYLNRVGDTKYYSGYAIFGQLRNNGASVGLSSLPIALPKVTFVPPSSFAITGTSTTLTAQIGSPTVGVMYRVFMTRVSSKGISSPYKNHFFIESDVAVSTATMNIDLADKLVEKFGTLPPSGLVYAYIDAIDVATGQMYRKIATVKRYY